MCLAEPCLCISTFTLRLLSALTHQLVNELQNHPSSLWQLIRQRMEPARLWAPRGCFSGRSLLVCAAARLCCYASVRKGISRAKAPSPLPRAVGWMWGDFCFSQGGSQATWLADQEGYGF